MKFQPKVDNIDINSLSLKEAQKLTATWSKRANQRLRDIEKHGLTEASNAYKKIEVYAFDQRDFMGVTKNGEFKFSTNTRGKDLNTLRRELKQLNLFLNKSKTSSPGKIKKKYQKGYETFMKRREEQKQEYERKTGNKDADMKFRHISFAEYGEMFRSNFYKKLADIYGSDEAIKIYSYAKDYDFTKGEIDDILNMLDEETSLSEVYRILDSYASITEENDTNEDDWGFF